MSVTAQGIAEINRAFGDFLTRLADIEEDEAGRQGVRYSPTDFMSQVGDQLGQGVRESYAQAIEDGTA